MCSTRFARGPGLFHGLRASSFVGFRRRLLCSITSGSTINGPCFAQPRLSNSHSIIVHPRLGFALLAPRIDSVDRPRLEYLADSAKTASSCTNNSDGPALRTKEKRGPRALAPASPSEFHCNCDQGVARQFSQHVSPTAMQRQKLYPTHVELLQQQQQ